MTTMTGVTGDAEASMCDVLDGLVDEFGNVFVVERVQRGAPVALDRDESKVTQHSQLMGDGRGFHADRRCEVADRCGRHAQPPEDEHATGRRQSLHGLGNQLGGRCVDFGRAVSCVVSHERLV